MGNKIVSLILLICFVLILSSGCSQKNKTDEDYIREWVQKKFGSDAKVIITTQLQSSFADTNLYRGVISKENKEIDGIFYFNKKDKTVNFSEIQ